MKKTFSLLAFASLGGYAFMNQAKFGETSGRKINADKKFSSLQERKILKPQ